MSFDPYEFDRSYVPQGRTETLAQYTYRTFLWMFLGLMVTFGVSVFLYTTNLTHAIYQYNSMPVVLFVAQLVVVVVLVSRVRSLSVGAARGLFLLYSALNGVVFSTLLYVYYLESVILVFALTSLYFGALALYGYFTKSDLSRLRSILFSGLIFLLVYGILSWFLPLSGLERMVSFIAVVVFLAYTAYDTQMIRANYTYYAGFPDLLEKAAVFSALNLYLDFINLFIRLLAILGRSRRN